MGAEEKSAPLVVEDDDRVFRCAVCNYAVGAASITNTDPECPELVRLDASLLVKNGPWFGIVQDGAEPARLVVVCSRRCAGVIVGEG